MKKINTDLPEYLFQSTITPLIDKIEEEKVDSELPWNTFGGSVYAGQRFIDYLNQERDFKINSNTSGIVASMGAIALAFFDSTKGANQCDLMLHSVSGGTNQEHTNEFFYKALSKKVDEIKFKEVTGFDLKKVLYAKEDERINVWITGKQAGYIGFFDETYDLLDKAASFKVDVKELDYKLPENIVNKYGFKKEIQINENDMEIKDVTVNALKSGNPEVFGSIINLGKKAEKEKVAEVMKYAEYDMKKAEEILKSDKELTKDDVAHFIEKKFDKEKLAALEDGSEEDLKAAKLTKIEKEKTTEEKDKEAALKRVRDMAGIPEEETKK